MKTKLSAVALVCSAVAASWLFGQESFSSYLPLKVGSKWYYRVGEDQEVVVKVLKAESLKVRGKDKQKVAGVTLEITSGKRAPLEEKIAVLPNGIFRFSAAGKEISPPLCILKLPPRKGETWQVDSTIGDVKVKGTFQTGEADFGKLRCITSVLRSDDAASGKIALEYYFAPKIGIVKQHVHLGSIDSTMELEKYEP